MVSIKITNREEGKVKKCVVPTKWEELTLPMFCRLLDLYKTTDKPDSFEIVAALLDLPVYWIKEAKVKDLDEGIFYYIQFLSDAKQWDDMWTMKGKTFEVDGKEYKLIDDIAEHLTLGEKEDIMQVLRNEESTTYDKAKIILGTFYKFTNANFSVMEATRIFPVVSFFLNKLKFLMIRGHLRLGQWQQVMNTLQV